MKKIYYIAIALLVSACSLEETPTSFVNSDRFYENETQCIAALNSCYLPLASIYTANYMLATEACTDLWYSLSTTVDACLDVTPAKPQFGAKMWTYCYQGVMRANECVDCIGASNLAEEVKAPLVAEARVLRALYYYHLTCFFNGVPFYTNSVKTDEDMNTIRRLPRTDADEIRNVLYDDLKNNAIPYFTKENGLAERTSDIQSNRAGYALGLMLMAKFAMWNQDWDAAMQPINALCELYGEFSEERYPLEQTMWRYKNTPESILEVQHYWSKTGVQFAGAVANIMTPSNKKDDSGVTNLYDGIYLPFVGNEATSWNSLRCNNSYGIFRPASTKNPSDTPVETSDASYHNSIFEPMPLTFGPYSEKYGRFTTQIDFESIEAGKILDKAGYDARRKGKKIDRRVLYTIGIGNLDSLGLNPKVNDKTFNLTANNGVGWPGPKFWCKDLVLSNDSNNYTVFRYADVILMAAECYINMKDSDNAIRYINMVRERAMVDPLTEFNGFDSLEAFLRAERARELGGEFMRKYDLVRWGIWYDQTYNRTQNATLRNHMKPCHRFYPIPQAQCALSGGVLKNEEYEEYGM